MKQKRIIEGTPFGPGKISPGCLKGKVKHDVLPKIMQIVHSSEGQEESFSLLGGRIGTATSGKVLGKPCGDCGLVLVHKNGAKVFAAFDGLGSRPDDFFASQFCAEAAKKFLVGNPSASMGEAILHIEKELMASEQWQSYEGKKPGCTACLVKIAKNGAFEVVSAGDCFAVLVSNFNASRLTSSRHNAEGGPSSYIGGSADGYLKVTGVMRVGDVILVSSDGLGNVLLNEIGMEACSSDMENAALSLVRLSNSRKENTQHVSSAGETFFGMEDDRLVIAYSYE